MSVRQLAIILPDLTCVVICAIAAYTDVRRGIIANTLALAGLIVGLVLNGVLFGLVAGLVGLKVGFLYSLAGALLLGICFGLMATIGFLAWGDVKLLIAVGALLRVDAALWALAYVSICGGVLGLCYALAQGRLSTVFINLFKLSKRLVGKREQVELHRVPYALAIFAGATWAALIKYLPWLRIG